MTLIDAVKAAVTPTGARIGVTDLAPFPAVRTEMRDRIETGRRADLAFTYGDPDRACSPRTSFPWGRSIIVAAVPYLADGDGAPNGSMAGGDDRRSVARFAAGDRYDGVRRTLEMISTVVTEAGWRTEQVHDDDRLVDRAVAVRSGVGWWGKSTMVLTPGFGPWFLIGSVVTDALITPTPPMTRDCGTCDACIPACPTGAIVAPGMLDARRCLAAVFQSRGSIAPALREPAGGRVYGCDACLVACPPGHPALATVAAEATVHPRDILSMSDREIEETLGHWYIPGRRSRFVRRNALVALGNVGERSDVALVIGYLGHHDALVREHAAWALGRLGGHTARAALEQAMRTERNPEALAGIEAALRE